MTTSVTDRFAEELIQLANENLSATTRHQVKRCLLDYIGVTYAGAELLNGKTDEILNYFGCSDTGISVIGTGMKASVQGACFLNALAGHVAELDDGSRYGGLHPGVPVISAVLALVEAKKLEVEALLKGIVVGYEAAIRLAASVSPFHKERGFHATGTCGTIGAAVGASIALGLSQEQLKTAISCAATSASGLLAVTKENSQLKPYNAAQAALNGLNSCIMASAGFRGPYDILGGKKGFLSLMADSSDLSKLFGGSNDELAIQKVYFKSFAACRHCHPAIEAALRIKATHGIRYEDIASIEVLTYQLGLEGHDHTEANSVPSAKMSTPISVAIALVTGSAGVAEYTDAIVNNPVVRELARKVKIRADESLSVLVPRKRPASAKIVMKSGETFFERVDLPKGEPENPMSKEELNEKFLALTMFAGMELKRSYQIADYIWDIEENLANLWDIL